MNLFGVMDVSASALKAERVRAEVVASNMANAETTRTAGGRAVPAASCGVRGGGRGEFSGFADEPDEGRLGERNDGWFWCGVGIGMLRSGWFGGTVLRMRRMCRVELR